MIDTSSKDRDILCRLAEKVAVVAALPVQEEKRRLWRALNSLRPERPMVIADQPPWSELGIVLECADKECRAYERTLRRALYRWEHFAGDWVVEPYIEVFQAVNETSYGVTIHADYAITDPESDIRGQHYANQFVTDADIEKLHAPTLTLDKEETARRLAVAEGLFGGVIETRLIGYNPAYMPLWDPISMLMSVEDALYTLIDRPDYMHALIEKFTNARLGMLDQVESLGLIRGPQPWIHCVGAYADELPRPGSDPSKLGLADLWCCGMAQMFSTVSPEMFAEFEVPYFQRIAERYGLVYYGCCEPLDDRIAHIRQIPHVRKISMSPWTKQERGAAAIGSDYVFSRKPNPAFLATETFSEAQVRNDLAETLRLCREYGCPCELILKDISTVRQDPSRLDRWMHIAMELVGA